MAERRYLGERARTFMRPLLAFGVVVGVFFLLRHTPFVGNVLMDAEGALASIGSGVGKLVKRLTASEDSLALRLNVCIEDKALLAREAAEYARLQSENAELRALLHYQESSKRSGIAAKVIARSLPEETAHVILDKGENDGVERGDAVVVGQGVVFGVVTTITKTTAVVTLVTSSESEIPSAILGKKKTVGLLEGKDGAVLSMQFIPKEAGVAYGDVVVTSGLAGALPDGLLLGTVTSVVDMSSAPFAEALVEPLEDPLEWGMVLVLPKADVGDL